MRSTAKIFCVAKNETDLMESWIVYHASLVGFDNLVVIDNASSCEGVLGVYDTYRKLGLTVEKCISFEGGAQGQAFTASMRAHQGSCMRTYSVSRKKLRSSKYRRTLKPCPTRGVNST